MGLWRAHDNGDEHGTDGILGALGIMLGLGLLAALWQQHVRATTERDEEPGTLGWTTFLILAAITAILVSAT